MLSLALVLVKCVCRSVSQLLESRRSRMEAERRSTRERKKKTKESCVCFSLSRSTVAAVRAHFSDSVQSARSRRRLRRLSLSLSVPLVGAPPKMRQSTLSFFLVPRAAAEDRENDDEDEEAGEEEAVEVSSGDDESGESGADGADERRGIETGTAPALLPPLVPLDDNAPSQHTRGTWSIPHHLKSRQLGSSGPRAKRPMVQSPCSSSPRRRPSLRRTARMPRWWRKVRADLAAGPAVGPCAAA